MYVATHTHLSCTFNACVCTWQYCCGDGNFMVTTRLLFTDALPEIVEHPVSIDVPIKGSTILSCQASGLGTLVYSWESSSGSSWTTVSINATSYTTDITLAIGQYKYRCRVSNEAGLVVSNIATVNVYGEYCPNM